MRKLFGFNRYQNLAFLSSLVAFIISFLVIHFLVGEAFSNWKFSVSISFGIALLINIAILLNILSQKIPSIEKLTSTVNRQHQISTKLFDNLKSESNELQKIYRHIHNKKLILKEFGAELIKGYLSGFHIDKREISLEGEHWALETYIKFWEYLANLQEKINTNPDRDNMIVRLTHSNDINIWRTKNSPYQAYAQYAYQYQNKFIENGGIVVRILIGKEEEPNNDYKEVMAIMDYYNIEAKYLPQSEVPEGNFDFMFLADEKIVLKWVSGNNGQRLAECSIVDKVEDEVERTWASLYGKLEKRGDPIKSIPLDRQHQL